MTAQPYHHGNLRTELLVAAERNLAVGGVDGLSLRGLARDLGVSHGAPARHFRDRQALLDALAIDGFARLNDAMAASATVDGSARDRLAAVARAYVDFALEHRELLAVMYATKHHPEASTTLQDAGHSSLDVAAAWVVDAQATGDVRDGDATELARVAFAAVHGVAMLAAGDLLDGVPVDTMLDAVVDVLWGGLARA